MPTGTFIVIEGTDGSGKTTQTAMLVDHLQKEGRDVETISFPQYGQPSAAMVEDYLNGKFGGSNDVTPYQASIFFAIDRYAASPQIRAWIQQGKTVVCNRYIGSNMGHQGAKISDIEELKHYIAWNYHLEYTIFTIPKPDINIILHVPANISQELVDKKEARAYLHGKKRDIHEDDIHHLENAERTYLMLAKEYPEFKRVECVENDQLLSPEIIHDRVWSLISEH